jgi:predicted NUDIX family phosphoesterase
MQEGEQVLVVERSVFESVGAFQGLSRDVDRYLDRFFVSGVPRFMPRDQAERDPAFKQLIPYVILRHGRSVISYVRGTQAGEKRLVGRRSIGIGGHINPVDDMPLFATDFRETYLSAVQREVAEEVFVDANHNELMVALLNDDSTEVGRVHLGIVHVWDLDRPAVRKREQMMTQLEFLTPESLRSRREELESWSQLCLNYLDPIESKAQNTSIT